MPNFGSVAVIQKNKKIFLKNHYVHDVSAPNSMPMIFVLFLFYQKVFLRVLLHYFVSFFSPLKLTFTCAHARGCGGCVGWGVCVVCVCVGVGVCVGVCVCVCVLSDCC